MNGPIWAECLIRRCISLNFERTATSPAPPKVGRALVPDSLANLTSGKHPATKRKPRNSGEKAFSLSEWLTAQQKDGRRNCGSRGHRARSQSV